jgi:Arm DNA-binding domain
VHGSRYKELSESLPALLVVMEAAPRRLEGSDSATAFALLAELHQATAGLLAKLGATDLAWLAAERAYLAAERSGDPLLAGISDFRLTHVFLSTGRSAQAQRVATVAAKALETSARPDSAPELLSVWGALNLVAAVIASTQGDRDLALEHLGKAETAAGWIGEDRNDYHTEFGPTNVALHSVAVSVELGDAGDALRKRGETWTWYLWVPDALAGKPRQRSKGGFRTKKECQDALNDALADLRKGTFVEPSRRTIARFLTDEWLPAITAQGRRPAPWRTTASTSPHISSRRSAESSCNSSPRPPQQVLPSAAQRGAPQWPTDGPGDRPQRAQHPASRLAGRAALGPGRPQRRQRGQPTGR